MIYYQPMAQFLSLSAPVHLTYGKTYF